MPQVITLEDSDRHFVLACKLHYGPTLEGLRKVYREYYFDRLTPQQELGYLLSILIRIITQYPIIEGSHQGQTFLSDLIFPKPWHYGLEDTADHVETSVHVIAGRIANWQVCDRADGINYDLGNPDPRLKNQTLIEIEG